MKPDSRNTLKQRRKFEENTETNNNDHNRFLKHRDRECYYKHTTKFLTSTAQLTE